jgi:hypothetical protein
MVRYEIFAESVHGGDGNSYSGLDRRLILNRASTLSFAVKLAVEYHRCPVGYDSEIYDLLTDRVMSIEEARRELRESGE